MKRFWLSIGEVILFINIVVLFGSVKLTSEENQDVQTENTSIQTAIPALFPKLSLASVKASEEVKLVSPEARKIADAALAFILKQQQKDGSWGNETLPKNSGITALNCMAIMSNGVVPGIGESGKKLGEGLLFLANCVRENGLIVAENIHRYGPIPEHNLATMALLIAYAQQRSKISAFSIDGLEGKIRKAVFLLLKSQKTDGGWRFLASATQTSDIIRTTDVMLTLRYAQLNGFEVPDAQLKKAEAYIIRSGKPENKKTDTGVFCHREGGQNGGYSDSCAGVCILLNRGLGDHKLLNPSLDFLSKFTLRKFKKKGKGG